MKIESINAKSTFQPVTLSITFEKLDELIAFKNRMMLSDTQVRNHLDNYDDHPTTDIDANLYNWAEDEIDKNIS